MKKKYMLLILAAAMMCTAMTGCGNKVNSQANLDGDSTVSVDSDDSSKTDDPAVPETPNGDAVIPANEDSDSSEQSNETSESDDNTSTDDYLPSEDVMIDGTDADGNLIEPEPDTTTEALVVDDPSWEYDEDGFVLF